MIRVTHEGSVFECASVEEAAALHRLLSAQPSATAAPTRATAPPVAPTKVWKIGTAKLSTATGAVAKANPLDPVVARLPASQKKALAIIKAGQVSIIDLREALGLRDNKAVSVFLASLRKSILRASLKWEDVVRVSVSGARAARVSFYAAGPLLKGLELPSA